MKLLRITKAKTRIGVLKWLVKFNPFLKVDWLYKDENIIAVHIHRYTGAIVFLEDNMGNKLQYQASSLQFAA